MDPLTICATVAGLVTTCGTAATTCNGLLGKYKNAPEILVSIRTECTAIKTTLSFVERLVKQDTKLLSSQLKAYSPLAETLDVALSGCAFTFSILDIELQKLYDRSKNHDGYNWKDKMRYLWDEDRVKNILLHTRGLQSAVNLVLTALQTASISALASLLQDQKSVIERVRQDTVSICENRSLQLGLTTDANGQASSENYSIFDSNIGDEIFSFDDEIVNSFAYRNALKRLASKTKATQQNLKPDEHHILNEPLIDLEGLLETHNGPRIKSTVTSNYQCLTPSKSLTHTARLSDTIMKHLKSLLPGSVASPSQQRNERHADFASPSCASESPNNTSANQSNRDRLVEKEERREERRIERALGAIPSSPPTFRPKSPEDGIHGGQYTHENRTKAFEDEEIFCGRLLVEHDHTNPEIDKCDRTSKEAVTNTETKPPPEIKIRHRRKNPTTEGSPVGILTAAALQTDGREYVLSNRDTRPGLSRQKRQKRRVNDNSQDSGHDASLIDDSEIRGGDGVASNSSIRASPRSLETLENSIRRPPMPRLEALKLEQRKNKGGQTLQPSHRGLRVSPVTSADLAHKFSKDASDSDASENPKPSRDENNSDVCKDAGSTKDIPLAVDRTSHYIPGDGKPVTIPLRKRRSSRDKGRGSGALTHASQRSQTSLLMEYFEGGKRSNVHSRPSVRVKVTPSSTRKIKDINEHIKASASNNNYKSSYM